MPTRPHSCTICNIIGAAFAVLFIGPLTWWGLDRTPAYEMRDGVARVITIKDAKGDPVQAIDIVWGTVIVHREGCKGDYQREIEDSIGHIYTFRAAPAAFNSLPFGPHHNVHSTIPWELPDGINEGAIKMRSRMHSICNPVQEWFPVHSSTPDVNHVVAENPLSKRLTGRNMPRAAGQ